MTQTVYIYELFITDNNNKSLDLISQGNDLVYYCQKELIVFLYEWFFKQC